MNLINKSISGIKWTSLSSSLKIILRVIQIYFLTKILSPEDFGLIALTMTIIGFSETFRDFGVSNAIIHKTDISKNQLSTLLFINIFLGIIFYLFFYFSASFFANVFNSIDLKNTLQILSVTFLINSFGTLYGSILKKHLKFKSISIIEIISTFLSFILSIYLAIEGYGIKALIYPTILSCIILNILYVKEGRTFFRPKIYFNIGEILFFIRFGLFQMSHNAVSYLGKDLDYIIIGKTLNFEILGIYTLAKELAIKPALFLNPIIMKVGFPIMSKVQNNITQLREAYLKSIRLIGIINIPIYFLMFISSFHIVNILFGEKWDSSIVIFPILCFAFTIRSLNSPAGALLLSKGKADQGFYWSLFEIALTSVVLYLGSQKELLGIAYSIIIIQLIMFFLHTNFIVLKILKTSFLNMLHQIFLPITSCLAFYAIIFFTTGFDNSLNFAIIFSITFIIFYTNLIYFYDWNSMFKKNTDMLDK